MNPDPTPEPPVDPRDRWALPPLGALERTARVDDVAWRVVAPNPSPMTLDGTNTYLVGAPGTGEIAIVDPGPDDRAHRDVVDAAVAARDAEVVAIVVTHGHRDHAEAAAPWARSLGCALAAAAPWVLAGAERPREIADGDRLDIGDVALDVVATPGHAADHVALRLPSGALLVGDHVLGRGTSVVADPDGDLGDYLDSLRRVRRLGPAALLPGHGPVLREDPTAVIDYYLAHREYRRCQLLAALSRGPADVDRLVSVIYPGLDPGLRDAAAASTRATIAHLVAGGQVEPAGGSRVRIAGSAQSPPP